MLGLIRILSALALQWAGVALALVCLWRHGPGLAVCAWLGCQCLSAVLMPEMPEEH
jgi:hypothetical protein